ncbi:MAG: DUF389 domain-containing protein [Cytophagaceae bacterium]
MPRQISVTCSDSVTSEIINKIEKMEGIIEINLYRNASYKPQGDIIKISVMNRSLFPLMRILDQFQPGEESGISVFTSEPDGCIVSNYKVQNDTSEALWEEMEFIISKDSNANSTTLAIMALSGILATIGLYLNALHIVIAGMLIAPGFMPITRIALGFVTGNKIWQRGIIDTFKCYLALMIAAGMTSMIFKLNNTDPLSNIESYYDINKSLISFWTEITFISLATSSIAGTAGALLLATKRSVFTSGVMIGLALIPASTLIPISLLSGDYILASKALTRFSLDVIITFVFSFIVLIIEQKRIHKRSLKV